MAKIKTLAHTTLVVLWPWMKFHHTHIEQNPGDKAYSALTGITMPEAKAVESFVNRYCLLQDVPRFASTDMH